MKTRKMVLSVLLCGILALSLAACGGGADKAGQTEKAAETEAVTEVSETEAPETEAVITEAPETEAVVTEAPETEAAQEEEAVDDQFAVGTNDGEVYENRFFNIRIDAADAGLLLATEEQLLQISNMTAEMMNSEDIKDALDGGKTFMDLYAYTPDLSKTINMNIQNMGIFFGRLSDIDTLVEMILPEMQGQMEGAGLENVTVEKGTCIFRGEEVPCVLITADMNGATLYEKQVYMKEGSYLAVLTSAGESEEESQAMLDLVKTTEE